MSLTLSVGGVPYTFAKLDAATYDRFVRWCAAMLPDPVHELLATAAKLPEALRDRYITDRIDAATDRKRLRGAINDPDFQAFAQTVPALSHLFWLLLSRHHPTLTEDQAFAVVCAAQEEHGERVFESVFQATRVPATEGQVEAEYFRGDRPDRPSGGQGV